ncbi:hypothetical protein PENSPDRAFT_659710 [Peniophora sp. CONT]|nr:hypothetical protein PENSPDRAFT_659710 [Peniophora sp. CONT]
MADMQSEHTSLPSAEQAHIDPLSIASPASISHIHILPPELLSLIVEAVAEREPPRSPVSNFERESVQQDLDTYMRARLWDPVVQGGFLGWIRLTHVCRSWRDYICENMPLLWAQHIGCFRLAGALEEMLRRAGENVTLSVTSAPDGYYTDVDHLPWTIVHRPVSGWSKAKCIGFTSRIRSLRIVNFVRPSELGVIDRDPPPSIMNNFTGLQVLEIHYFHFDLDVFENHTFSNPGTRVLRAPNLREIRFTNYFIPWTNRGLTHLSLSIAFDVISGDTLLEILNLVMFTIEVLELDECLPSTYPNHARQACSFPRLHHLHLRDQGLCVSGFLQIIRHASLTSLDLTIRPTRDSNIVVGSVIKDALLLMRYEIDRPFKSMTASREYAEDGLGSLRAYIRFGFSRDVTSNPRPDYYTTDFDLSIAIENPRHLRDNYRLCLAELRDVLGDTLPTIWDGITHVDLDVPLWRYYNEMETLLKRLANLRELRLIDPLEDVKGPIISLPELAFVSPESRLDVLWIVQHADWEPDLIKLYCSALAEKLGRTSPRARREAEDQACQEQPFIALLRLDFVKESGTVQEADEEDLSAMFGRVAGRVELRFS